MIKGIIFSKTSGRIEYTMQGPDLNSLAAQATDENDVMVAEADGATQHIKDGAIVERPVMGVSVTEDQKLGTGQMLRVGGIPVGTRVICPGFDGVVDDGYIEWLSVTEGTYHFMFVNFPYREVEFDAIVTAV